MSEWQPIETAPAATCILIAGAENGEPVITAAFSYSAPGIAVWVKSHCDGHAHITTFDPTHWMPLPKAPKS